MVIFKELNAPHVPGSFGLIIIVSSLKLKHPTNQAISLVLLMSVFRCEVASYKSPFLLEGFGFSQGNNLYHIPASLIEDIISDFSDVGWKIASDVP